MNPGHRIIPSEPSNSKPAPATGDGAGSPPSSRPASSRRRSVERRHLHTLDAGEAQWFLGTLYPGVLLEPPRRSPFEYEVSLVGVGPISFVTTSWPHGGHLRAPYLDGQCVLSLSTHGRSEYTTGTGRVEVAFERQAALLSAGLPVVVAGEPGFRTRTVVIDSKALDAHLATLVGRPAKDAIVFEPGLSVAAGRGASVAGVVDLIWREQAQPEACPLFLASLAETLLTGLLTGVPNSAASLLRPPASAAPGHVRRAEEYILAHAAEPLTLADIVAAAGVPARALQIAFQKARGTTPMELLRARRFELARDRLLVGDPEATVAGVAEALGFGTSPGRFSVEYRKRFGESPSETLAAARARCG